MTLTTTRVQSIKLRPVTKGFNGYCGPAVISALTGMDTDAASRLIRSINGRKAVKGTHAWEINSALQRCGMLLHQFSLIQGKQVTLAKWHQTARKRDWFKSYPVWLVAAGRHWQLVTARQYVCGKTIDVVSIRDPQVKRRARVTHTYAVMLAE